VRQPERRAVLEGISPQKDARQLRYRAEGKLLRLPLYTGRESETESQPGVLHWNGMTCAIR
jgi:hypothetical protein